MMVKESKNTLKVFIANFGQENYLWATCREQGTVATFEDADLRPFWERGDREGYISHAIAHKKTAIGATPTKQVASRWFNLASIISDSVGDTWIHREKDELWWTVTKSDPARTTIEDSHVPDRTGPRVYVIQKPTMSWSNKNKKGEQLLWKALHPRARDFLFTEGTLQQLSNENAAYALALINGEDLSPWHSQIAWKTKEERTGKAPASVYSSVKRTAYRMATTAMKTAAQSNGQEALQTIKSKDVRFNSTDHLQQYIEELLTLQRNLCAITSLPLQFDGEYEDYELLCSLDRIDSNGHYEPGNLQIVCRFINRWKSDSDDAEFRRLVHVLKNSENSI
jgi:hypothetical protein